MKKQIFYFLLMLLFACAFVFAWYTKGNYKSKTTYNGPATRTTAQAY